MKTSLRIYTIIGSLLFLLGACAEEQDMKYSGPSAVEFKNYYYEIQNRLGLSLFQEAYPNVVPTENASLVALTVKQPASGIVYSDSILVQLVGPQLSSDTEVNYEVAASSTAVEGVHFSFVKNASGKVLIKGNTSSGYIYINVPNSLSASSPDRVTLTVTLTGNNELHPSENYKTFTYNIIK